MSAGCRYARTVEGRNTETIPCSCHCAIPLCSELHEHMYYSNGVVRTHTSKSTGTGQLYTWYTYLVPATRDSGTVVHHHKKNLDRRTTTVQNAIGEVLRKGRRFKRMVYVHVLVQLQSFRRLRINNIDSSSSLISSYYRSISNHRNVIKIRYMLYIQSQLHQSILLFHGDC